ncbi:MAG TPA: DUF885 domain-containing protein [Blastocatellia bacterium]|nr:DUF885 domain-containing protein [Blastocatellia bacterium]
MIRNAAVLSFILFAATAALAQVLSSSDAAGKLRELFDEDWQWLLREYPESATLLGDNRYNDRLTDYSIDAIERRKAHEREMLSRIQRIDRAKLSGQDVISYDLFLRDKRLNVEGQRFPVEYMPIDQMNGVQIGFGQLVGSTPFRSTKDYEDYLARLSALPKQTDQLIALMRRGIETKWVPPAIPMRSVPGQIEGQITDDPGRSPYYKPFEHFPEGLPAAERARLSEAGRKAIGQSLAPALKKLDAFVKETYLPACRKDIGASSLPEGEAFYQYSIKRHTTTSLSAAEIHQIGKREVARIRREMEAIIRQVGFKGSFQDFLLSLRSDQRFYYKSADDLVAGYSYIAKQADGRLPQLFAELPRTPYGVRVIPDYEAPAQTTAYYQPGAADGSRAGLFMINTYKLDTRPKYEMEALTLHESVPGHHLQIARAQELKGLPDFRRNAGYTAYVEGWGLYAESLGSEMGFYAEPYSKFGQLTYEMWRACRLVVDTGMHAFGMSRQQAIDLLKENTAKTENDIVVEVDRYIAWPGQALAYKMGELKLKELRAKASKELGARFDVREFHNAVLDDGALPLDVLEQRIAAWIADQKRKE